MQKLDSLRAAIVAVIPELQRAPALLKLWIDKGRIIAPMTPNRDFGMKFTVTLELVDFTGHPSVVFLAINDWLRLNQPEAVAGGAQGYTFESDIVDASTIDLIVTLELTESVRLTARDCGGWNLEHVAEPALFPDDEPITVENDGGPSLLKQIYWNNELLVE